MPPKEILTYIKGCREKHIPDEQIKANLLHVGWSSIDVEAAFTLDIPKPVVIPHPSGDNMWNAFEHILLFITLYTVAISSGLLLHAYVDKWFPGATAVTYSSSLSFQSTLIRGYLAALIVSFPLFVALFFYIAKRIEENPSLKATRSRKLLIYLTLIFTFIFVLSNVISIVYELLNGNVSMNFVLHFFVTVLINGFIFIYYFSQIKEDRQAYA